MSRHKQHSFAVPWFAATRYPCLSRPVLIIAGVLPKDAVDRIQKPAATRHRSGLAENPTLCQIGVASDNRKVTFVTSCRGPPSPPEYLN